MESIVRLFGGKSFVGGVANFLVDFGFEGFDLFLVEDAFADEEQRKLGNRVAMRFVFALFGSFVKFLVVGKRMGIGARYVRVNESGSATVAAILNGGLADGVAFERIGAIAFGDVQARETAREFGDAAAGGLHLDRNGNGVAVVFDQVKQKVAFWHTRRSAIPRIRLRWWHHRLRRRKRFRRARGEHAGRAALSWPVPSAFGWSS